MTASVAPQVSVIVVNYNAGPLLSRCVGAVLGSDIPVEVVVSDNGSTDDSLTLLRATWGAEARLTLIENGANLGFAKGNNKALPHTQADYLLFLNPDSVVEPATLGRVRAFLENRPDVGMAGCLVLDPDGSEQVACRRSIPDPWIALKRILHLDRLGGSRGRRLNHSLEPLPQGPIEVEAISGSFMMVRRAALDEVGPLDEGYFLHCEDLDWFVRFHEAGWKIALVPSAGATHYKGSCSTSTPIAVERHKHRGMERFFRKHQAQQYPRAFGWLVIVGIRLHFGLKALVLAARHSWRNRGRKAPR
ncbi:glycosyltransferase family 2 protein [Thiorhodococcus mannitoliphagus]|uniref:Glycosyltransferase family 2 protein n=1 Tax=Thiorhodococcus mannitoliphagus TaxID=329406 RepID=A0A6P1DQZ2_9GAMM|nr:glycosyltransferase family 2 protein [Thiorhodococcus mannitoliphagus]NEX19351.1 glycosyltransferase family 2 protein [Thiorhodococcus mannitoliphagus]